MCVCVHARTCVCVCFLAQTKKYADVILPRGVDNGGEGFPCLYAFQGLGVPSYPVRISVCNSCQSAHMYW